MGRVEDLEHDSVACDGWMCGQIERVPHGELPSSWMAGHLTGAPVQDPAYTVCEAACAIRVNVLLAADGARWTTMDWIAADGAQYQSSVGPMTGSALRETKMERKS
jgi:hypothetical protein